MSRAKPGRRGGAHEDGHALGVRVAVLLLEQVRAAAVVHKLARGRVLDDAAHDGQAGQQCAAVKRLRDRAADALAAVPRQLLIHIARARGVTGQYVAGRRLHDARRLALDGGRQHLGLARCPVARRVVRGPPGLDRAVYGHRRSLRITTCLVLVSHAAPPLAWCCRTERVLTWCPHRRCRRCSLVQGDSRPKR